MGLNGPQKYQTSLFPVEILIGTNIRTKQPWNCHKSRVNVMTLSWPRTYCTLPSVDSEQLDIFVNWFKELSEKRQRILIPVICDIMPLLALDQHTQTPNLPEKLQCKTPRISDDITDGMVEIASKILRNLLNVHPYFPMYIQFIFQPDMFQTCPCCWCLVTCHYLICTCHLIFTLYTWADLENRKSNRFMLLIYS